MYTAAITDVLTGEDHDQTLPHDIVPLTPETRLAGVAFPATGKRSRNARPEPAIRAFLTLLGAVPGVEVLVIQANDDVAADFGELSAIAMKARGVRGVVVDGATRDSARHYMRERFPALLPVPDSAGLAAALARRRVGAAGDHWRRAVSRRHWSVGDFDGIVVVPTAWPSTCSSSARRCWTPRTRCATPSAAASAPLAA